MIGPEDLARLDVLAHPVGELCDVPRGDEDVGEGHDGRIELEHVLLDDKVLSPGGEHVGLERRSGGSVIVQSGNTCEQQRDVKGKLRRRPEVGKGIGERKKEAALSVARRAFTLPGSRPLHAYDRREWMRVTHLHRSRKRERRRTERPSDCQTGSCRTRAPSC
jgi:hypothetical protein